MSFLNNPLERLEPTTVIRCVGGALFMRLEDNPHIPGIHFVCLYSGTLHSSAELGTAYEVLKGRRITTEPIA